MHFHFHRIDQGIVGWMSPDNPGAVSHVEIVAGDGTVTKMRTNVVRPDVRDAGFHHTGEVGFIINDETLPGFNKIANDFEIRAPDSGLVLFRPFKPEFHLAERVFRFEMQAMPYADVESAWSKNFALYYNALERYPFDTLRWILSSPNAESIALSGRISLTRYEHFLREHNFRFIALLKDPFEELAERLLFVRYAKSANAKPELLSHLVGLEGLEQVSRRINLAVPTTIPEAFAYLSDKQLHELSNPVVKALTCSVDEYPTRLHVEVALNRLATMDLVGVRSNYGQFKSVLSTLISRDILPEQSPAIGSVAGLTEVLRDVKVVKSMLKFDELLYRLTQEAVDRSFRPSVSLSPIGLDKADAQSEMQAG